jgi:hypothetical protein
MSENVAFAILLLAQVDLRHLFLAISGHVFSFGHPEYGQLGECFGVCQLSHLQLPMHVCLLPELFLLSFWVSFLNWLSSEN